MKKFAFRLDPVIRYREFQERMAQRELEEAKAALGRQESEIQRLIAQRVRTRQLCQAIASAGLEAAVYRLYRSFISKLDRDIEKAKQEQRKREQTVHSKSEVFKKTRIRKKSLSSLRENRCKTYLDNAAKEEQARLDEMVLMKARPEK